MTLSEFKLSIINNEIDNQFKIFLCETDYFIATQYIEQISKQTAKEIQYIQNIQQIYKSANTLIIDNTDILNVLITDTFTELIDDYSSLDSLIVVCKKIDKSINSLVAPFIIKFPKLIDWQIKDYILTVCPGLTTDEVNWLYDNTEGNIYKIDNEISKIALFSQQKQSTVFNKLRYTQDSDIFKLTIFDLADAVITNDRNCLINYYKHYKLCNFDPIALTNILLANFKKIILVTHNSNATIEDLKITKQQYNIIKYKYATYPLVKAQSALKFLAGVDQRLKLNQLDFNKYALLDYIILNIIKL